MPKGIRSPCGGLIGVAGGASVGNFVLIRHRGRDEREGVSADENARNRDLDLGHVACDAFATRGAVFVVRVLCECRLARSVPRARTVAIQAYLVHRLSKLSNRAFGPRKCMKNHGRRPRLFNRLVWFFDPVRSYPCHGHRGSQSM